MERRTALKLIAAGVIAERLEGAHQHLVQIAQAPAAYKLQFFSAEQNLLLDRLTESIVPADDHSPGASAAQVSLFIDLMVANSRTDAQAQWLAGLRAVEDETRGRFGKPFLHCNAEQQDQILAAMSAHEGSPETELERFFARLKGMTADGYYTSTIGIHKELGYKGSAALAEFPGCTHPEHKRN